MTPQLGSEQAKVPDLVTAINELRDTMELLRLTERRRGAKFVASWLRSRAQAYRADADHVSAKYAKATRPLDDAARLAIAVDLDDAARDVESVFGL